ncbi:MAG: ribokinase [Thermoproteota archaeon]|nr:ribokinase [Candidatus Brockarchaeota archaeon]
MEKLFVSGTINWDITLFVDKLPLSGQEVLVNKVTFAPGGKGGNVSVAASRLLERNEVSFIGALGKDEIGNKQVEILKEEGVDTEFVAQINSVNSGQAYIAVETTGQNIILTYFGANEMLSTELFEKEKLERALKNCNVLVFMDAPVKFVEDILRIAKSKVIWSPGPTIKKQVENIKKLMSKVNYLILNEHEFEALYGTKDWRKTETRVENLIVTLGKEGAALISNGSYEVFPTINLEAYGMPVVNTVGCGDAFVGAFAAMKQRGFQDNEAIKIANCAAAFKATKPETRGSPRLNELKNFLGLVNMSELMDKL